MRKKLKVLVYDTYGFSRFKIDRATILISPESNGNFLIRLGKHHYAIKATTEQLEQIKTTKELKLFKELLHYRIAN